MQYVGNNNYIHCKFIMQIITNEYFYLVLRFSRLRFTLNIASYECYHCEVGKAWKAD